MFKNIFLVVALLSGSQAIFGFGCCKCWPKGQAPIAPEIAGALSPRAQLELGDIITRGVAADAADGSRFAHHPGYEALRAIEIKTQENLAFAAAITRAGGVPTEANILEWQRDSVTAADLRARITRNLYPSRK